MKRNRILGEKWVLKGEDKELITAVMKNNAKAVEAILASGVDPNLPGSISNPLEIASRKGYSKIVKILIAAGANVNPRDRSSPLTEAVRHNRLKIVRILLSAGIDSDRDYPLHIAIFNGNMDIVKLLIFGPQWYADADTSSGFRSVSLELINKRNSNGISPLLAAVMNNQVEIALFLISIGAKVFDPEILIIASGRGFLTLIETLLKKGVNPNAKNSNGYSPIYEAVSKNQLEIVILLLSIKVELNFRDHNPLNAAIKGGNTEIVKLLLDAGADISFISRESLGQVFHQGKIEIIEMLLDHSINVDITGYNGNTPLYTACYNGNVDVVKLLIEYDANPIDSKGGGFPLIIASRNRNLEIVQMLVNHIMDWNNRHPVKFKVQQSNRRSTIRFQLDNSLVNAVRDNNVDMTEVLLVFGANPNAETGRYNETSLFVAARYCSVQMIELLLRYGGDINKPNSYGDSPINVSRMYNKVVIPIYQNYTPSFATLALNSIRINDVDISVLPPVLRSIDH